MNDLYIVSKYAVFCLRNPNCVAFRADLTHNNLDLPKSARLQGVERVWLGKILDQTSKRGYG